MTFYLVFQPFPISSIDPASKSPVRRRATLWAHSRTEDPDALAQ